MALFTVLMLSSQLLLLLQVLTPSALASIPRGDAEIKPLGRTHHKIFHPPTNSCVYRQRYDSPLTLAPCDQCDSWNYTPQKFLTVVGTYYCLKAVGPFDKAKLSIACDVSDSQWNVVSDSYTSHISTTLADQTVVCLDVDEDNTIITNPCNSRDGKAFEGDSQWFQVTTLTYGKDQ